MPRECPDVADLGELATLPAGDPRLAHVENCAHCRSLMAEFRAFEAGNPALSDPGREQQVADFLVHAIEDSPAEPVSRPSRSWWRSRALAPSLAVAAVLLLMLSWRPLDMMGPPGADTVMRGDSLRAGPPDLQLQGTVAASGALHLTWSALPSAESYEVVLYSASLTELAVLPAGTETSLDLAAERLAAWRADHDVLVWRVRVYVEGDLAVVSSPAVLSPTE